MRSSSQAVVGLGSWEELLGTAGQRPSQRASQAEELVDLILTVPKKNKNRYMDRFRISSISNSKSFFCSSSHFDDVFFSVRVVQPSALRWSRNMTSLFGLVASRRQRRQRCCPRCVTLCHAVSTGAQVQAVQQRVVASKH